MFGQLHQGRIQGFPKGGGGGLRPAIRNSGGGGGGGGGAVRFRPDTKSGEGGGGGCCPLQARYKKRGEGVLSASGPIRKAGGGGGGGGSQGKNTWNHFGIIV